MPRWRQCKETGKFIPIDGAAARHDGVAVHGDMASFVSPIDGSVISDRKQYRDHCKKHGVVPAQEFSPEFYAKKAEERARLYTGERTREQIREDRMKIHETINRLERAKK